MGGRWVPSWAPPIPLGVWAPNQTHGRGLLAPPIPEGLGSPHPMGGVDPSPIPWGWLVEWEVTSTAPVITVAQGERVEGEGVTRVGWPLTPP